MSAADAFDDESPTRLPLSRDRIAAAALTRIDAEGLDALSMRKLGTDLGVEAMSLYNHVRNKDDLLRAVSELLHGKVLHYYDVDPAEAWQDKARVMALAWWRVGNEHPHAFSLIADNPVQGVAGIRVLAECMNIFTDAGFSLDAAVQAFQAAAAWLIGAVTQELGLMRSLVAGEGFADDEVPGELRAVVDFKRMCVGTDSEQRFRNGLEVLLAGVEARLAPVL
jgi:AcrR family transcriptional regulator